MQLWELATPWLSYTWGNFRPGRSKAAVDYGFLNRTCFCTMCRAGDELLVRRWRARGYGSVCLRLARTKRIWSALCNLGTWHSDVNHLMKANPRLPPLAQSLAQSAPVSARYQTAESDASVRFVRHDTERAIQVRGHCDKKRKCVQLGDVRAPPS